MKLKCLYASEEASSDVLYLSGIQVPDAYLSMVTGNRKIAVVSQLEYSRVKATSKYTEVYELNTMKATVSHTLKVPLIKVGLAQIILYFKTISQADFVEIPQDFPSFLLLALQEVGIKVKLVEGSFFQEREQKSASEIKSIAHANKASALGFKVAESALKESKIKQGKLYLDGSLLSSERLRFMIESALFEKGATAPTTIVAGGVQACDPHQIGHGALRADELIIIDIFPKIKSTGYHGDMTRTFLKGKASDAQKALVQSVRSAQKIALAKIKPKVHGSTVHAAVVESFTKDGYKTEKRTDADTDTDSGTGTDSYVGFIHSTGHGLGLDVHEFPSLSPKGKALKPGHVVTVEPGLYYPEIGACRIEDVVAVTQEGSKKISNYPYTWQLA
jgi:Xaa-Pro aminopeptidase